MTLLDAYLNAEAVLMPFYAGAPTRLYEKPRFAHTWDAEMVHALAAYQKRLGLQRESVAGAYALVTGQQPGLFTGPLYTVYKAITAIKAAARFSESTGERCVPIFWNGSEDHDFAEAATAHVLTKKHALLSLTYTPETEIAGRPMHSVPIEESLHAFVDTLARQTAGSEYRDEVQAFLHETLNASESLADWAVRIMARLFRDTPLQFFSPHLPEARRVSEAVLAREIEDPLETTRLVNETGAQLAELGYAQQVVKGADECSFFVLDGGKRCKVTYAHEMFTLGEHGKTYSADALQTLLKASPESFSPNVALRCVVQQRLFPALAYVAGPGELSYWGQIKPVFARHELPMPFVLPRLEGVLTTSKLTKIMEKHDLSIGDLTRPEEALLQDCLKAAPQSPELGIVQESREKALQEIEGLMARLAASDPTAASLAERVRHATDKGFEQLGHYLLNRDAERVETVRAQIARLQTTCYPLGKPQERVLSVVSFLFSHGWELLPRLMEDLSLDAEGLQVIEL